jgi:GH35 family endo-1,4-beta-xylanase
MTMKKRIKICLLLVAVLLPATSFAQLSSNPDKFLGNITTGNNNMDFNGFKFSDYWNQVTPENATKWQSVEGTRGQYNWGGADNAYKYAQNHNFPFKFHCFVWGSQYPGWIKDLTPSERYKAIEEWMDAAKEHYPDLQLIDVVNEAMKGHQNDTYLMQEALGGDGKTGYDWLIKAFEMVHERWPNAILIYNDYNVLQWGVDEFIGLVGTLRDAGAPIDAYGCQAHSFTLNNCSQSTLKNNMSTIQKGLKMPMYVSEYDINFPSDADQERKYKEQIPVFWEADYVAGVTLWGWFVGNTWQENTGLIKNKQERSALKWLREYMATDAAKNAKSPYPGMKKEASIFIRPASMKVARNGDVLPITVRAYMATKTIEKVDLYVDDELIATMTDAPYKTEYTTSSPGWKTTKAVVTTTDGATYERYGRFQVLNSTKKRAPYPETVPQLPGTINIAEYDEGASGVTYNNASRTSNSMKDGQWMDYTVDVAEEGLYSFDAEIASSSNNGIFHLAEFGDENLDYLTEYVSVPKTGGSSNYKMLHGKMLIPLTAGRHVISVMIDKGSFNFKSLSFSRYEEGQGTCMVKAFYESYGVGDYILLEGKYSARNSTIKEVRYYANNLYIGTATEAPYTIYFVPEAMDTYAIKAILVNAEGQEKESKERSLVVDSPTPTAISTVTVTKDASDNRTYNLMGVPVDEGNLCPGIYIRNGRKFVVK